MEKIGLQVFISYGNHTNDHYLMIYGFTIPDNPNEKYLLNDLDRKVLQHATVDPDRLKYMNNTALMQNLRQVSAGLPSSLLILPPSIPPLGSKFLPFQWGCLVWMWTACQATCCSPDITRATCEAQVHVMAVKPNPKWLWNKALVCRSAPKPKA